MTYKDLDAQALSLASSLLLRGVASTDRVLFFGDNSIEYFTSILAFTYLGVPFSPCKPANGPYETFHQLIDMQATVLVVSTSKVATIEQMFSSPEHASAIAPFLKLVMVMNDPDGSVAHRIVNPTAAQVVTFSQLAGLGQGCCALPQVPFFHVDPSDSYVIAYTSGTTGLPKGAIHSHRSFVAMLNSILTMPIFSNYVGSKFCSIFPFGHISGTVFVPVALLNSMPSLLYGDLDHQKILKSIEHYQAELLPLVLELATDLYSHDYTGVYDLSSLRAMYYGGSKFPAHVLTGLEHKYNIHTREFYGATEFMGSVGMPTAMEINRSVGVPMPGVEMKIVDLADGASLPPGQQGEICFRGPMRFVGYLNNAKATRETIDEEGFYHSGDVGYYDECGRLYITDRIKELIKYKHWSIAPAEIETFLTTHQAVSAACVVGVSHATEGSHLRAYIKLTDNQTASEKELVEFVKGKSKVIGLMM